MRPVIAVVVAAGRSRRMSGTDALPTNKLLLTVRGRSVLSMTLRVFQDSRTVNRIYVTSCAEDIETYTMLAASEGLSKVAAVLQGGDERQQSVHRALQFIRQHDPEAGCDPLVAIHDGARPLLVGARLEALLHAADGLLERDPCGATLLCVPIKDTLKRVQRDLVIETIAREEVMVAQTPQVFRLGTILGAHEEAAAEGFAATDDAMLLERKGATVLAVHGDYENIKVTTPEDLVVVEGILDRRQAHRPTRGLTVVESPNGCRVPPDTCETVEQTVHVIESPRP